MQQEEKKKVAVEVREERENGGRREEESTLASPGMPADHERCRYDGFTFYSLPTGRFTSTAPSTFSLCALYISSSLFVASRRFHCLKNESPLRDVHATSIPYVHFD